MNKAKVYHGQADVDKYSKVTDRDYTPAVSVVSIRQIKEAYNELMEELMLESQEAY